MHRICFSQSFERYESEEVSFAAEGERGDKFSLTAVEPGIFRVTHFASSELFFDRSWVITPGCPDIPYEGRGKFASSGFSLPRAEIINEQEASSLVVGEYIAQVSLSPLNITWRVGAEVLAQDSRPYAYGFDPNAGAFCHLISHSDADFIFGLGEKSGRLNKSGRVLRMFNNDAFGYDAEHTDPLYKHIPLTIGFNPAQKCFYAYLYDSLANMEFDLGVERHASLGRYRKVTGECGGLCYYFIYGETLAQICRSVAHLTGRPALPPRWSFGYLGSTMQYTEAENAAELVEGFATLCEEWDIPCDLFHLSSGYTSREDRRYVFTWNRDKFPNPGDTFAALAEKGIETCANIKPCLLQDHPEFESAVNNELFLKDASGNCPQIDPFWGGDGAHLDFTNPAARNFWKKSVSEQLFPNGITSLWNDNNEYAILDGKARCHGDGESFTIEHGRAIQTSLMARSSFEAMTERSSEEPLLVSRAGALGLQRYAQTWTGDNVTSWHTLKYNIPMGLGLSISGFPFFGHDVGGFCGPKPTPELFLRWIQHGIFYPRFTIHSWNEDETANEPWMYPEIVDEVRKAIQFRYRLIPTLYSLAVEAHRTGEPMVRPLFYHHSDDPLAFGEDFAFLLGEGIYVPFVGEDMKAPTYLPQGSRWVDFQSLAVFEGGRNLDKDYSLSQIPFLMKEGSILVLGDGEVRNAKAYSSQRAVHVLPKEDGEFVCVHRELGSPGAESHALTLKVRSDAKSINIDCVSDGSFHLAETWLFYLPQTETRRVEPSLIRDGEQDRGNWNAYRWMSR